MIIDPSSFPSFPNPPPTTTALTDFHNKCQLRIFVGDISFRDIRLTRAEGNVNFDTMLGLLQQNTSIYFTLGSGDDGVGCDHFSWDFTIQRFPIDNFSLAYGNTLALQPIYSGLITTFAGYRSAFHSPSYLREGWAYLWNGNGPIGINTSYVVIACAVGKGKIYIQMFVYVAV